MTHKTTLRRLQEDVGDLLERREEASDFAGFDRYADDPVGFIRDVLGDDPWDVQEEVAEAVRDHAQVTVRSCHAAGKDWLGARLALWWTYAQRGLVVLTGPTRTQVEEILMRKEVRDAFQRAGELPGSLHVNALRPGGEGRAGILAKTAVSTSALIGFHDERVLFIVTEPQNPQNRPCLGRRLCGGDGRGGPDPHPGEPDPFHRPVLPRPPAGIGLARGEDHRPGRPERPGRPDGDSRSPDARGRRAV